MASDINCRGCGEDVCIVSLDGRFFARPGRFSKCRFYRAPSQGGVGGSKTCRSELCATDMEALVTFPHGQRPAPLKTDGVVRGAHATRNEHPGQSSGPTKGEGLC